VQSPIDPSSDPRASASSHATPCDLSPPFGQSRAGERIAEEAADAKILDGEQDGPAVDIDAPPAVAGRRFCRSCGSRWDSSWVECPHCAVPVGTYHDEPAGESPFAPGAPSRPVASALWLYFILLGTMLPLLAMGLHGHAEQATMLQLLIGVSIVDAFIVAAWCISVRREVAPLLVTLGNPMWYAVAMAIVPVTFLLATATVAFLVRVAGLEHVMLVEPILRAGYGWTGVILLVCVQPAIFEELAFRGVILGGLRRVLSDNEAVVVSALMFMIIHLSFVSFPHLVLLGLVLGYLRVKSGSLYPCVAVHFLHNLAVSVTESWI
jgi:membrane protease YdiL (CAAX protease family)